LLNKSRVVIAFIHEICGSERWARVMVGADDGLSASDD